MLRRDRLLPTLLLIISLISLIIIAGGLSQVSLRPSALPPIRMSFSIFQVDDSSSYEIPAAINLIREVLVVISIAVLPIAIIYVIFSREAKSRVLRYFLLLTMNTLLFLILLPRIQLAELEPLELPPPPDLTQSSSDLIDQTTNSPLSDWIIYGLVFICIGSFVFLAWYLIDRIRRQRKTRTQMAKRAEEAVQAVKSGQRIEDAVVRCYYEMCQILKSKYGLPREYATTPREFEYQCVNVGLPKQAVITLTRLFEQIRYGGRLTDSKSESEALSSLRAISELQS